MPEYKLYLVERTDHINWDQFDSFVVSALNEDQAQKTAPGWTTMSDAEELTPSRAKSWTDDMNNITVTEIGKSSVAEWKVICSSFNAG